MTTREALEALVKAVQHAAGLPPGTTRDHPDARELDDAMGSARAVLAAAKAEDDRLVAQVARLITFTRHLRIGETGDGSLWLQVVEVEHEEENGERVVAWGEGGLWDCLRAVEEKVESTEQAAAAAGMPAIEGMAATNPVPAQPPPSSPGAEWGEPSLYLEPWTCDAELCVRDSEGVCVASAESELLAERIVACVNALAGIADPLAHAARWRELEQAAEDALKLTNLAIASEQDCAQGFSGRRQLDKATAIENRLRAALGALRKETTPRDEHMAWCKKRALELLDAGRINEAFTSMASDLGKHPETAGHSAIQLGLMLLMGGHLRTAHEMRKFIEGFR